MTPAGQVVLVAVPGGRVAHVASQHADETWPQRAVCGAVGEPRPHRLGTTVLGGMPICRRCQARSPQARHLVRAQRLHTRSVVDT